MENEIINRVEQSNLIQVNLDDFYPLGERISLDITDFLVEGLVLREKPFREAIAQKDWSIYKDKLVAILFKEDAIVPLWAYMLIASKIAPFAKQVVLGNLETLEIAIFNSIFQKHDFSQYHQKNVIVKGCGKHPIPETVFINFTLQLQQHAKNIMFGEACSSVPIYKR